MVRKTHHIVKKFYLADEGGYVKIEMPTEAKLLSVGYDHVHEFPVFFAEIHHKLPKVIRTFYTQSTGEVQEWKEYFGTSDMVFIGTAFKPPSTISNDEELGLHIYEIISGKELPGPISGRE